MPHLSKKIIIRTAAAVIAAVGIAAGLWLYLDGGRSSFTSANPSRERYPVRGIDVSAHNDSIDFDAAHSRDSISFVFVKATEGTSFKDRNFVDNILRAKNAGMAVGAYHFFRFESSGLMQALNFLHSVRGRNLDLPLAIDVEEWGNPRNIPTETIVTRLAEMTDYLTGHGYRVIIYTNKDGLKRFFSEHMPGGASLWICSFNDPPGPDQWLFWQHSHRGKIAGVNGHVDLNVFNGAADSWLDWIERNRTQ